MVRDVHACGMISDLDIVIKGLMERLGRIVPETVKLSGI
jgi:hypothetical protein